MTNASDGWQYKEACDAIDMTCPPPGSRWRHRKGGLYEVVCGAIIEATLTAAVVYRALSGGRVWVRPLSEFKDGRFTPADSGD